MGGGRRLFQRSAKEATLGVLAASLPDLDECLFPDFRSWEARSLRPSPFASSPRVRERRGQARVNPS